MSNWKIENIGKFATIGRGSSPRPITDKRFFENGTIPWIKIADATAAGRIIYKTKEYVNEYGASFSRLLKKGSLILSASGVSLGIPRFLGVDGCIHDGWLYLENIHDIDVDFLYYKLLTLRTYFDNLSYGAAIQNINTDIFSKTKISLPPLPTQQKIASILSTYDNLIQNYKKQIEDLQTCASELYKEWFVRFRFPGYQTTQFENGIPVGWKVERIGNVGEVIGGGTPSTEKDEYWDGDIPWLSPVDLSDNTNVYVSKGSKNITELGLKKSSTRMMPKDTVLLSSRAPVGYVALAKNPICTNQGFKSVVCDSSKIKPIYLYFYFKMNKNYLQSVASGATFPELSGSMMKKLKVLLPPIELQELFSNKAAVLINKAELLSEQITNLTQQRDLLLPRLMSGKLV